jgi:putative membrane protein
MEYHLLLGLHAGAVAIWIGGIFLLSIALYIDRVTQQKSPPPAKRLGLVRLWSRWITSPAMVIVWGLGIAMTFQIPWYLFTWFKLKILIVILLSAVYGIQMATVRRIQRGETPSPSFLLRFSAPITAICTIAIAVLVVAKPFGA